MRKTISFLMLSIAVMLASCSQSDELSMNRTGETVPVTFTAQLDGSMNVRTAKTRTTDVTDEAITRAVMEIYDNQDQLVGNRLVAVVADEANITFTAELTEGETYTCLIWADGGEGTYNIDNLEAIGRGTNPSIAYYAKNEITASSTPEAITLTHAVSKIVLHETATLTAGDKVGVSFSLPEYTFNVTDGSCTAGEYKEISKNIDIVDGRLSGQLGWLYVFAPATGTELTTMTLSYTANGSSEETKQITNVPLKPNFRTVLKGEFAQIGIFMQDFDVTLDKNWAGDNDVNIYLKKLITTAAGQITYTLIDEYLNTDDALVIEGPVNDIDIAMIQSWAVSYPNIGKLKALGLKGTTGLTVLPDMAFAAIPAASILLPESITTIGEMAFSSCENLSGFTVPSQVETIGWYAFAACTSLEYLVFEGTLPVEGSESDSPTAKADHLVLNNKCMGNGSGQTTGFNVFLPNITDATVAKTYSDFFGATATAVYYNCTGNNYTDTADYTKYE